MHDICTVVAATVEGEVLADVGVHQATLDLVPVLVVNHVALQPVREIGDPVLAVALAGNPLAHLPVGNEEREHGEERQPHDHHERHQQVRVERPVHAAQRPHDSQGRDQHHEDSTHEEWNLQQHLLAIGVTMDVDVRGLPRGADAQQKGQHVEGSNHNFAYAKQCSRRRTMSD